MIYLYLFSPKEFKIKLLLGLWNLWTESLNFWLFYIVYQILYLLKPITSLENFFLILLNFSLLNSYFNFSEFFLYSKYFFHFPFMGEIISLNLKKNNENTFKIQGHKNLEFI